MTHDLDTMLAAQAEALEAMIASHGATEDEAELLRLDFVIGVLEGFVDGLRTARTRYAALLGDAYRRDGGPTVRES